MEELYCNENINEKSNICLLTTRLAVATLAQAYELGHNESFVQEETPQSPTMVVYIRTMLESQWYGQSPKDQVWLKTYTSRMS